nr:uncharacterized protein LOC109183807 [Ipomoea batatas]
MNGSTWYLDRSSQRLGGGAHEVEQISAISAKVDNVATMRCYMVDAIDGKTHDEGKHFDPHDERALDELELWKYFSCDGDATFVQVEKNPMVEKVEEGYLLGLKTCVGNFIEASDGGSLADHPG